MMMMVVVRMMMMVPWGCKAGWKPWVMTLTKRDWSSVESLLKMGSEKPSEEVGECYYSVGSRQTTLGKIWCEKNVFGVR